MPKDEEVRSRPGLIIFGIIIVVGGAVMIFWLHSGPKVLPSAEMIQKLKTGNPREQVTAAEGLGKLRDPAAVDPLIAALTNKEWTVRRTSAQALGQIGDGLAVPALIQCLKDDNIWVVISAAQALAKIGDASAIKPMEKRLKAEKKKQKGKQSADLITLTEEAIQKLKGK
ncbi:MAG: HEAT repeat domain-containing protein [Planctomycetes bacterium]|nr:HEAT repeat domain-containing protein [Planctomycetota bacterium]